MENPQEDPLAVHCFYVCSRSALLGDNFGVSRSMEHDLLSVLLIYPRIFLHVFITHCLLVWFLYVWLYSAICSSVLVVLVKLSVLAKWLAIERPLWWYLHEVMRLSPQSPGGRACLYVFFFCLVCLSCYVFPHPIQCIFHMPMAWYSLYVLKVPLNTKQTNKIMLDICSEYINLSVCCIGQCNVLLEFNFNSLCVVAFFRINIIQCSCMQQNTVFAGKLIWAN